MEKSYFLLTSSFRAASYMIYMTRYIYFFPRDRIRLRLDRGTKGYMIILRRLTLGGWKKKKSRSASVWAGGWREKKGPAIDAVRGHNDGEIFWRGVSLTSSRPCLWRFLNKTNMNTSWIKGGGGMLSFLFCRKAMESHRKLLLRRSSSASPHSKKKNLLLKGKKKPTKIPSSSVNESSQTARDPSRSPIPYDKCKHWLPWQAASHFFPSRPTPKQNARCADRILQSLPWFSPSWPTPRHTGTSAFFRWYVALPAPLSPSATEYGKCERRRRLERSTGPKHVLGAQDCCRSGPRIFRAGGTSPAWCLAWWGITVCDAWWCTEGARMGRGYRCSRSRFLRKTLL